MQWNAQQKRYDANILLKQGYYNYMYAFQPHLRSRNAEGQVLNDWFGAVEGNHHMAGNRYDFFAYYWDLDGYDRVIGHEVLEVAGR